MVTIIVFFKLSGDFPLSTSGGGAFIDLHHMNTFMPMKKNWKKISSICKSNENTNV